MSISPFHGGLTFREGSIDSQYPTLIENVKNKMTSAVANRNSDDGLNNRNLNEFFNPLLSKLSLQERYDTCASVGEDIVTNQELMDLLKRK